MAGIYIHIPFCKRRCFYCDFYTTVNVLNIDIFIDALVKEIINRKNFLLYTEEIETLYFGGGTPSLLTKAHYDKILTIISKYYNLKSNIEFTIEANPEDLTKLKIKELKELGVNRLSIGSQSFNLYILNYLNRKHNPQQAIECVYNSFNSGIENISIDLIYGIPVLSNDQWLETIHTALSLPIKHFSAYHLTIEPKTTFSYLKDKGKFQEIDEEDSLHQFNVVHEIAETNGFEHYEISNFAKPGYRSKHNSNYWLGIPYIGFGPSAHSFDGSARYYNISDLKKYIENIDDIGQITQKENLSTKEKINEQILIHLRRVEGLDLENITQQFGRQVAESIYNHAQKYIESGHLIIHDSKIRMNTKGWFISDKITADLFMN